MAWHVVCFTPHRANTHRRKRMKRILFASTAILLASLPLTGTAHADVAIVCNHVGGVPGIGSLLGCTQGAAESGLNNILFSDPKAIGGTAGSPLFTLVGI